MVFLDSQYFHPKSKMTTSWIENTCTNLDLPMVTMMVGINPANTGRKFEFRDESNLAGHFTTIKLSKLWTKARKKTFIKKIFFHNCIHLSGGLNCKDRACCFWETASQSRKKITSHCNCWKFSDTQESNGRMKIYWLFYRFLFQQGKFPEKTLF